MKGLLTVGALAALLVLLAPVSGHARQDRGGDDGRLEHFYSAVQSYVALHREVERTVPPLEISSDARKIYQAVEAMRSAMRAARPSARPGDIFDPGATDLLRVRIRETLRAGGHTTAAILHRQRDEDTPGIAAPPVVNEAFPWAQGSYMPACLFAVLPTLSPELEFRLLERDLVLVDTHASLVVDVLVDVLPADDVP
jgi:hypothetical protein